jgi:Winged helix DNA-binding domain
MRDARPGDAAHRLSWRQAVAWRMAKHRLVERAAPAELVRIVGDLCGLHAQVTSSAELGLWARTDGLGRDAVRAALWTDRTLVKLWAARGTLYLLPADELGMWLSALGTLTKFGNAGHPEIDKLSSAVGRALDGRVLTREELAVAVGQVSGSPVFAEWVRVSWGSYLKAASFRGLICFAPNRGTEVRFTAPATWVRGGIERPEPMEALRAVTRRFLAAYAPATVEDLTRWWLGPPMPRRGAQMLGTVGDEAVEVDVEGHRAWVLARDLEDMLSASSPDVARLLPAFDPWVIGAARTAPLLEPQHLSRVYRPQGWVSPALLVNGRIVGTWRHVRRGRRLTLEIEPFGRLPAWARAQLEAEVERLADFLDCGLSHAPFPRSI